MFIIVHNDLYSRAYCGLWTRFKNPSSNPEGTSRLWWEEFVEKVRFNTRIALWSNKSPTSVFASLKISVQIWVEPFSDFLKIWLGTRCNSQVVNQCTGGCLACRQTYTNYFETGEISSSAEWFQIKYYCNSSGVVKVKFSTTGSSEKVFTNKGDIDKQPEIAIWLPRPEDKKYYIYHQNSNGGLGFST